MKEDARVASASPNPGRAAPTSSRPGILYRKTTMQAIDLLAELFQSANVRVVPRQIISRAGVNDLRRGIVGKVQGLALGEGGELVFVFECNNASVEVWLDGEPAVEAAKALKDLPCNFPEEKRRAGIMREMIGDHSRDGADLSLLGKFGK